MSDEQQPVEATPHMDIAYFNKNGDPKYGRIFVQAGSIGLDCGGKVVVMPLEKWIELAWHDITECNHEWGDIVINNAASPLDPPLNVTITKCVRCGELKP